MNKNVYNNRVSKKYRTNSSNAPKLNFQLFIEDFSNNIVPMYSLKLENITCKLIPNNKGIIEMLHEFVPYSYLNFDKTILQTVIYIAKHLLKHGFLVLELVEYKDINEKIFYKLEPIYGKEVKINKKIITQIIHDDVAQEIGTKKVNIPVEKCFVIEFPKSLGGKKRHLQFLKEFKKLESQTPMMLFNNTLINQKGYNFISHRQLYEIEIWKITKMYNWHPRESNWEKFSGFYIIYKRLLFRRNQIILRDYVIEKLSQIISSVSEIELGQKSVLKIEGLLPLVKMDEIIKQWESGELKISNLNDIIY